MFKFIYSKIFSILIAISLVFGLIVFINSKLKATAGTQIQSIIGIKKVGDPTYVTHVTNLHLGDHLRVQLAAINNTTGNTIDDLQFYSTYAKDGVFGWVKADSQAKVGGINLTYDLPAGDTVQYVPGSTYYESNETGSFVGGSVTDNSFNESLLFVNDSRVGIGFHKQNLPGNTAAFKYIAYYDLVVVSDITPVFNARSDDQPTFQVKRVADSSFQTSLNNIIAGDELMFKIYVHNNPRGSVALNSKVGVENWPGSTQATSFDIKGFVVADNAAKAASSVALNGNSNFALNFESGSVRIQGWPTVLGSAYDPNAVQSDNVITPTGIMIGDQGRIDGCWDFIETITFKATVQTVSTPTPTPTITPTSTPTATPTVTPTITPTPTSTPTPSPTPTTPPSATSSCTNLTASTTNGTTPLTITFTGSGTDSAGSIQQYQFNFGDSSNGQQQIVTTNNNQASHVYYNAGNYTANLIVKDSRGVWVGGGSCQLNINVNAQPTVLGATAPPALPKTGSNDSVILLVASIPTVIGGIYLYRKFKLL